MDLVLEKKKKKSGYSDTVKFLEEELHFHVVRNMEKVVISVKRCYLGASPQTSGFC